MSELYEYHINMPCTVGKLPYDNNRFYLAWHYLSLLRFFFFKREQSWPKRYILNQAK